MDKTKHPFRMKWGQNFVIDSNLIEKSERLISPKKNDSILEIGPGDGSLTKKIFPNVKEMVAIEIDPLLIKKLTISPALKGLNLIHGDILHQDIEDLPLSKPPRVIGNIPYNITSPIIFWLIEQLDFWQDAYIMMQFEVAERLLADPGSKDYSRITVMAGGYLNIDLCFKISPEVFYPRPKVQSAIVRFTKKKYPVIPDDLYVKFGKIVKKAFSMRRKMLKNSLKEYDIPDEVKNEIDFSRRPETLSLHEFAKLVDH